MFTNSKIQINKTMYTNQDINKNVKKQNNFDTKEKNKKKHSAGSASTPFNLRQGHRVDHRYQDKFASHPLALAGIPATIPHAQSQGMRLCLGYAAILDGGGRAHGLSWSCATGSADRELFSCPRFPGTCTRPKFANSSNHQPSLEIRS